MRQVQDFVTSGHALPAALLITTNVVNIQVIKHAQGWTAIADGTQCSSSNELEGFLKSIGGARPLDRSRLAMAPGVPTELSEVGLVDTLDAFIASIDPELALQQWHAQEFARHGGRGVTESGSIELCRMYEANAPGIRSECQARIARTQDVRQALVTAIETARRAVAE